MVRLGDPVVIICDNCHYILISIRVNPEDVVWVVPHCQLLCPQCGYFTELTDTVKLFQPKRE